MSNRSPEWHETFADKAVMEDLRAALREMAGQLDDCDPETCMHAEQRVHPYEVYEWIERELRKAAQAKERPVRFERGHRPRRRKSEQLSLAIAG